MLAKRVDRSLSFNIKIMLSYHNDLLHGQFYVIVGFKYGNKQKWFRITMSMFLPVVSGMMQILDEKKFCNTKIEYHLSTYIHYVQWSISFHQLILRIGFFMSFSSVCMMQYNLIFCEWPKMNVLLENVKQAFDRS